MQKQLVVLSGFLGSGKTTVLCKLLARYADRNIAVLLNDFGDIPVDGAVLRRSGVENGLILEIGGGSVFCACLKDSFIKALKDMAERSEDLILIEASGMSDPSAIDKMLHLSGLDQIYNHSTTLCLFDPVKSLKLAKVLEVIPRQLAAASVAILTKADLTSTAERDAAKAYIQSIEPDLPVLESIHGEIDFTGLPERTLRAFSFGFNTPETRPDSFNLTTVNTDVQTLIQCLQDQPSVLRVKGYVHTNDGTFFVSDTGYGFDVEPSTEAPVPLTIICMQETAKQVLATLKTVNIV